MSKKVTKQLYQALQAKLDAATAAITGKGRGAKAKQDGKGKGKDKKQQGKKAGRKAKAAPAPSVVARLRKGKAPSEAEANLQRNVRLLKKLGAHRTQDAVLKKVMASR